MADEPENLTIRPLQEPRSEMRDGFEKAFSDLAALRKDMSEMQHEVAAMRVDQRRTNERLSIIPKSSKGSRKLRQPRARASL